MKVFEKVHSRKLCYITMITIILSIITNAQGKTDTDSTKFYYLNLGVGVSTLESIAAGMSFTYQLNKFSIVSARYYHNQEVEVFSNGRSFWDVGAMYGLFAKSKYFYFSASIGIAFTGGVEIDKKDFKTTDFVNRTYKKTSILTIGYPMEVTTYYTPYDFFEFGVIAFTNYNSKVKIYGGMISIRIGNLDKYW